MSHLLSWLFFPSFWPLKNPKKLYMVPLMLGWHGRITFLWFHSKMLFLFLKRRNSGIELCRYFYWRTLVFLSEALILLYYFSIFIIIAHPFSACSIELDQLWSSLGDKVDVEQRSRNNNGYIRAINLRIRKRQQGRGSSQNLDEENQPWFAFSSLAVLWSYDFNLLS